VSNKLVELLKDAAPVLATAVAGPAGGAVVSFLAKKFGVEDTVASVAQAIAGDPEAQAKLQQFDFEYDKLEQQDRASAREMQIAALAQSDVFSKRFVYYLATFWSCFAVIYILVITLADIPEKNVRFADTILGFILGTVIATLMNFFFGSSKSSLDKTEKLAKLAKGE
jgi:hypothetical protein